MNIKHQLLLTCGLAIVGLSACNLHNIGYQVPQTYHFLQVNYRQSTEQLGMLAEMVDYMRQAHTPNTFISAARLQAMYMHNAPFADFDGVYAATNQLKNSTFESQQPIVVRWTGKLEVASQSQTAGSEGQAGVIASADGSTQYLLAANGIEYAHLIEKGIMGACFYYQATSVWLGKESMNADNTLSETGVGTALQHHWDLAFGYLGVPPAFPADTQNTHFWGRLAAAHDSLLATNALLMEAFLTGRAAIGADDLASRDAAIPVIRAQWERVAAGAIVHYLNLALSHAGDVAVRHHALSGALGLINGLPFNAAKTITNTQVQELLVLVGNTADFETMNLYQTTDAEVAAAKAQLVAIFDLANIADKL